MSNTEQAQEPTMEEILASIRRIISDDTETSDEQTEAETAEAEPTPEEAADEEFLSEVEAAFDGGTDETPEEPEDTNQIDFDSIGEDDDDDVLELTDVVEEEPAVDEAIADEEPEEAADDAGDIEFVDMDEAAEPEMEAEPELEPELSFEAVVDSVSDDRIMSEATDGVVADAFGQLATTLLSRDGTTRTLEELVQEMLRPMLKSWLDENLPSVVENLVRQEIERAARRGGR